MSLSAVSASRRTLLRSTLAGAAALTVGGGGLLTATSAQAAPIGGIASAGVRPKLPASWKNTIFTAKLPNELQGYVAAHGALHDLGAVSSLSAARAASTEVLGAFLPQGQVSSTESFTPQVSSTLRLDAPSTAVTFVGDAGTRIAGHVQLVRTANPMHRALLLRVDGRETPMRRLPARTQIVGGLAPIDTPAQLTASAAKSLLRDAIVTSFVHEAGADVRVTIDRVALLDQGQHVSARVRGTVNGMSVNGTWYGASQLGDGGWYYLFGKLPA